MYRKIFSFDQEYIENHLEKEVDRHAKNVKTQASILFYGIMGLGKENTMSAARGFCRASKIYPCSFSVMRFLTNKAAAVQDVFLNETGGDIETLINQQSSFQERFFVVSMLRLAETISLNDYRNFSDSNGFYNSPIADIKRFGANFALTVIQPDAFVEFINQYPSEYDDYFGIPDLIPLLNYGLKVDSEKWSEQRGG